MRFGIVLVLVACSSCSWLMQTPPPQHACASYRFVERADTVAALAYATAAGTGLGLVLAPDEKGLLGSRREYGSLVLLGGGSIAALFVASQAAGANAAAAACSRDRTAPPFGSAARRE